MSRRRDVSSRTAIPFASTDARERGTVGGTPPRVLFLDHTGALGGAELCLLDIVRHRRDSSKVLLFADGPFRARLKQAGVPTELLAAPRSVSGVKREGTKMSDLRALPGVLGLARRTARLAADYDVLYANSQKAFVVGALAARLIRKPIVWHLHDVLTAHHFSRSHRRLVVALANASAARVIANSEASADAFSASGGRAGRARVVYNGIDPAPFESVTHAQTSRLRKRLGLAGVPVVGVFSRLAPWKGQHVLLEAMTHLPGVHAMLVGGALFDEHEYAAALRSQAEEIGVAERIHFLGFREDVPRLMRLSDVVAHTSTAPEPFGRMIVEGMLARRPVVASRAGGALEIVRDGENGALVPPGEPRALAAALRDLLTDPVGRENLADAGYRTALDRFSLRAMLDPIEHLMQEVATRRSKS